MEARHLQKRLDTAAANTKNNVLIRVHGSVVR